MSSAWQMRMERKKLDYSNILRQSLMSHFIMQRRNQREEYFLRQRMYGTHGALKTRNFIMDEIDKAKRKVEKDTHDLHNHHGTRSAMLVKPYWVSGRRSAYDRDLKSITLDSKCFDFNTYRTAYHKPLPPQKDKQKWVKRS